MIQIGGVYTTFCQEEGILLQKYAIEMGGVSRYFSKVLGSGVDVTLLIRGMHRRQVSRDTWEFSNLTLPKGPSRTKNTTSEQLPCRSAE